MVSRSDKVTANSVPNSKETKIVAKKVMSNRAKSLQAPILNMNSRSSGNSESRERTATKMMDESTALGR